MWIDALGNMQDEFPTGSTALYLVGLCSVLLLVNLSWKNTLKRKMKKSLAQVTVPWKCAELGLVRGPLWNYWHPFLERKRKIYSSTWDSIISRCSLWGLNPSLDPLHKDRKNARNSVFLKKTQRSPWPHHDQLLLEGELSHMLWQVTITIVWSEATAQVMSKMSRLYSSIPQIRC